MMVTGGFDKIPSMPKLRYNAKFKTDVTTESYRKANITLTQRSILAQLWFGILLLAIETDNMEFHLKEDFVKYAMKI